MLVTLPSIAYVARVSRRANKVSGFKQRSAPDESEREEELKMLREALEREE